MIGPRFLVYDIDKRQSSPTFTDEPSQHHGSPGNLDVLVDLVAGIRKYNGEWAPVDRVHCYGGDGTSPPHANEVLANLTLADAVFKLRAVRDSLKAVPGDRARSVAVAVTEAETALLWMQKAAGE